MRPEDARSRPDPAPHSSTFIDFHRLSSTLISTIHVAVRCDPQPSMPTRARREHVESASRSAAKKRRHDHSFDAGNDRLNPPPALLRRPGFVAEV
jgi:hypothetical protein